MLRGGSRRVVESDSPRLAGRRLLLRPLDLSDFSEWRRVRQANMDWLTRWEPLPSFDRPSPITNSDAFRLRCAARTRERQLGTGFGFGLFRDNVFVGEMNINSVQRGAFQSCYVGYWVDETQAGNGYAPEALVCALRYAFSKLKLHRVQIAIVPSNAPSRRVVEKLDLRFEGVAERYLEINGKWEDHMRFAITAEEWGARGAELLSEWIEPV